LPSHLVHQDDLCLLPFTSFPSFICRELLGRHIHVEVLQGANAIQEAAADSAAAAAETAAAAPHAEGGRAAVLGGLDTEDLSGVSSADASWAAQLPRQLPKGTGGPCARVGGDHMLVHAPCFGCFGCNCRKYQPPAPMMSCVVLPAAGRPLAPILELNTAAASTSLRSQSRLIPKLSCVAAVAAGRPLGTHLRVDCA